RRHGRAYETEWRNVGLVAQTGGGTLSAMKKEEIIVCGSGIAGMATALGLARKGFDVSLLGPAPPRPDLGVDDYHPRVYAISVTSRQLLESLGVWQMMDARRVTP